MTRPQLLHPCSGDIGRDSSTYLSGSAVVQRTRDLESMGQHVRRSVAGAKAAKGTLGNFGVSSQFSLLSTPPLMDWNWNPNT